MFAYPRRHLSTADVNAAVLLGRETNLRHLLFTNDGATEAFLKLYDQATIPAATDTPLHTIWMPPTTYNQGFVVPGGIKFKDGLAIRITGEIDDNGTTAIAANQVVLNYGID